MHYRYGIITRYAFIGWGNRGNCTIHRRFQFFAVHSSNNLPGSDFSSNSTAVLNMPFSGEEIINGTAGTIVVCVETVGVIVPRTTDTVFSADVALSVRLFFVCLPQLQSRQIA